MKGSIEHFDHKWHRNEISASIILEISLIAFYKQGLTILWQKHCDFSSLSL